MTTFKDAHPKLSAFLNSVGGAAPSILEGIGSIIPGAGVLTVVGKAIGDSQALTAEQKTQALAILQEENNANIELAKVAEADSESARNREVAVATSDKVPLINKIATPVLGFFIVFAFFLILTFMLYYDIPASNKTVLDVMLGSLGTMTIQVAHYYFGSSSGSKDKDAQVSQMIQNQS